jgi:hypothetical protein
MNLFRASVLLCFAQGVVLDPLCFSNPSSGALHCPAGLCALMQRVPAAGC